MRPLNILTWDSRPGYLYYLTHVPHHFYYPIRPGRPECSDGPTDTIVWPGNLHAVPAEEVKHLRFDCILFQAACQYEQQQTILSPAQRNLPQIYLEHDPPRQSPTETKHPVDDPDMLLVHTSAFNALMWDNGRTSVRVIPPGVSVPPDVHYRGDLPRGIVVVNGLGQHGRRWGIDVFERARREIPLDLIGAQSQHWGGFGEVAHHQLPAYLSHYRFLFHPSRYDGVTLSICEAMMIGLPIVAPATTEVSVTIASGVSGYVGTDVDRLIARMHSLLENPQEARRLGEGARRHAQRHFSLQRFVRDWDEAFALVTDTAPAVPAAVCTAGAPAPRACCGK